MFELSIITNLKHIICLKSCLFGEISIRWGLIEGGCRSQADGKRRPSKLRMCRPTGRCDAWRFTDLSPPLRHGRSVWPRHALWFHGSQRRNRTRWWYKSYQEGTWSSHSYRMNTITSELNTMLIAHSSLEPLSHGWDGSWDSDRTTTRYRDLQSSRCGTSTPFRRIDRRAHVWTPVTV